MSLTGVMEEDEIKTNDGLMDRNDGKCKDEVNGHTLELKHFGHFHGVAMVQFDPLLNDTIKDSRMFIVTMCTYRNFSQR